MRQVTFKHYSIVVMDDGSAGVYDPRFPKSPAIYAAPSLKEAKEFVSAYRDGEAWSAAAALAFRVA